jgi:hypothetical protein
MRHDDPENPPGDVSDQMPEEQQEQSDEGGLTQRRPSSDENEPEGGEAGEGSQSTGHPEGAG